MAGQFPSCPLHVAALWEMISLLAAQYLVVVVDSICSIHAVEQKILNGELWEIEFKQSCWNGQMMFSSFPVCSRNSLILLACTLRHHAKVLSNPSFLYILIDKWEINAKMYQHIHTWKCMIKARNNVCTNLGSMTPFILLHSLNSFSKAFFSFL